MITINDLHKFYQVGSQKLHVLKGLDLTIKQNELVSIMGASGSGKSTLLNILGLLDTHDSGVYHLDGMEIKNLNEKKAAVLRNEFIGFVFQSFNLIHYKTALENVTLPLYYQNIPKKIRREKALHYLEKVGLVDRAQHLPTELSGGQKQRVAIARALVTQPKVILADEPTGALDSKTSENVIELFREIHGENITIVVITHDKNVAEKTDRIVKLKDGMIIDDTSLKT